MSGVEPLLYDPLRLHCQQKLNKQAMLVEVKA